MPQRLNPDCPSQTHQSIAAIRRKPSCICPGPHHEAFVKFRQQENAKRAAYRSEHGVPEPTDSVIAPDFYSPAVPEPTHEAGRLDKLVIYSDDIACRGMDVNLFYPIGSGPDAKAQERFAKSICRTCPLEDSCLTAALKRGEPHGIFGGATEAERRRMRAQMAGHAA